jgi:UMF1 family MFS transporter
MVPSSKTAEFFGFYDISSKFSGVLGPLVFGLVGTLTGTSRLSILAVVFFFITGAILLSFVDHEEGKRLAREAEAKIEAS